MRIVTDDMLAARHGLSVANREQVYASVLDGATAFIEEYLGTPLARKVDALDYFSPTTTDAVVLRLARGFVLADEVAVRLSTTGAALTSATDGSILSTADYDLDAEKGLLTIPAGHLAGRRTVSVTYTAGFLVSNDQLQAAPGWLQEAACQVALRLFNEYTQGMVTNNKARDDFSSYGHLAGAVLNSRVRPRAGVLHPVFSTEA